MGMSGRFDHEVIGLSLGFMYRKRMFAPNTFGNERAENFMPVGSLRVGQKDKLSFDLCVFDDPHIGFSLEPQVRTGLRWGFNNPSGDTYLTGGAAFTSTNNTMIYIGAAFPILKNRLYGGMTAYAGTSTMISGGLKYRFGASGED